MFDRWQQTRAKGWRKISTSVWRWPVDPQIYGRLEVDASPIIDAIQAIRAATGTHVTVTHLVTRGVGLALAEAPSMNTKLVRGHFIPRGSADVFVIASTGAGKDLDGLKITSVDSKSAADVAAEVIEQTTRIRAGAGSDLERAKRLMAVLPSSVLRPILRATSFLSTDLGLDLSVIGVPREPFGGAMVTNVGMFGLQEGYAPLGALYRVPAVVFVGEITDRPWVVAGNVEVRPVVTITATIDHRWVDGHGAADLARTFRAYLEDPLAFEPPEIGGRVQPDAQVIQTSRTVTL